MAAPGTTTWRGPEKISTKRYKCSKCGGIYRTSTNHWGTIYRGCEHHYYGNTSECVEAEEALKEKANGERFPNHI